MESSGGATIPLVSYILSNEIWFVLGMCLSCFGLKKWIVRQRMVVSLSVLGMFGILSVVVYMAELSNGMINFLLGLLACYGIVSLMIRFYERKEQSRFFGILAQYTMPIFLMHTLFAAPLRTVLFKLGIHGAFTHVALGIAISFVGPMIAAIILKKSKWLEFFVYPGKFIRVK